MARPIVLSNGSLHVGINNYGLVHDFYYPHVGSENHASSDTPGHRVGVWVDERVSWLGPDEWSFTFSTSTEALIGHVRAKNEQLGIMIEFDDFVDAKTDVFFRNLHVVNLRNESREVRVFMHQAFTIGDTRSFTDTAQYLPSSDAIVHYRGNRVFVVSGESPQGGVFDQRSIGLFGIEGREGTYKDAEDGELSNGNVEHGRVDSTLRFVLTIKPHSSERLHYWISVGTSLRDALLEHKFIQEHGLTTFRKQTIEYWHEWLAPARKYSERLPKKYRQNFIRSALTIKSHIDNGGAIIASTDTAMLKNARDAYGYCWPRDGAYAIWPLIRLGYSEEALAFFAFCKRALHPSGYLMHKFYANGSLGPSWHPYIHGDISAPPIQEDETALTLFVFTEYYKLHPDAELLDAYYDDFVVPMAEFLCEYIDDTTKLPKPSYELWEEEFLTSTYTTAVTQAALFAASELAEVRSDSSHAVMWRSAADDMRKAAKKLLFDETIGGFRKGIIAHNNGIEYRNTIDASCFYAPFMFGLVAADSSEMKTMANTIRSKLQTSTSVGVARYEEDNYCRRGGKQPNPWFICTLWLAQYAVETGDESTTKEIIDWVNGHITRTGLLSEQIDPENEASVSVSPLVWSHAEFVSVLLDLTAETEST